MAFGEPIKAIELIDYIKAKVPYTYYVNDFPRNAKDDGAYVRMTGGYEPSEWTTKKRPSFQVVVRGGKDNGPYAEETAYKVYRELHNRSNFTLSDIELGDSYYLGTGEELETKPKSIVHCRADQSSPIYVGKDENDRPIYSMNFTLTTV